MSRHFTLPIAFAAALHAALLFAFPRLPPRARPAFARPKPPPTEITFVRAEPEPAAVEEESDAVAPRQNTLAPPVPRGEEPVVIDPGPLPTMDLPPVRPRFFADVLEVPGLPFGEPGGVEFGDRRDGIVGRALLDNPPRTRLQIAPVYPFEARREGFGGDVVVEFIVDEAGRVHEPRTVRSTHRVFEEPALRAVAKWQFEPGRRNGRIVRFRMAVPVVFSLNE